MYFIAFIAGLSGIPTLYNEGPTPKAFIFTGIALGILAWKYLDQFRSTQNRSQSMVLGICIWVNAASATLNHLEGDYGFFFWAGLVGSVLGTASYVAHVVTQIREKRMHSIEEVFS